MTIRQNSKQISLLLKEVFTFIFKILLTRTLFRCAESHIKLSINQILPQQKSHYYIYILIHGFFLLSFNMFLLNKLRKIKSLTYVSQFHREPTEQRIGWSL